MLNGHLPRPQQSILLNALMHETLESRTSFICALSTAGLPHLEEGRSALLVVLVPDPSVCHWLSPGNAIEGTFLSCICLIGSRFFSDRKTIDT